jgi:hypothetical protein
VSDVSHREAIVTNRPGISLLALARVATMFDCHSMRFDELEETVNEISDRDWSWWPFLWLRPEKHAELTLSRVIALSLLYGLPCGVLTATASSLMRAASHSNSLFLSLAFPLLFLFAGSAIVAPMWNRRAERLRARIDDR